ncbi:MAG TPA: 50S ribosomal protein L15 [Chloroflexia bacterium]|nr:50S ribosomal protein L15 [Chloroflexia bacterium]
MKLSDLRMPQGANKDRKRVGRGHGSGHVKTAGKGTKGQKSRTGGSLPPRFQGGQTPIQQQLPYKRGFTNIWKTRYNVVNLSQLESDQIETGGQVTPDSLHQMGIMRNSTLPLKILGDGDLSRALHITAHKVSESARQKIEAAGGTITLIETEAQPRRSKGRSEAPVRARAARLDEGRRTKDEG